MRNNEGCNNIKDLVEIRKQAKIKAEIERIEREMEKDIARRKRGEISRLPIKKSHLTKFFVVGPV